MVNTHRPSAPNGADGGKFQGALPPLGREFSLAAHWMKTEIWGVLTPSPSSLLPDPLEVGSRRNQGLCGAIHLVGEVPGCVRSGSSPVAPASHPYQSPAHQEATPGPPVKTVPLQLLHPLTRALFGRHSLLGAAARPDSIAHHNDFASCSALRVERDATAPCDLHPMTKTCLPHS